MRLPKLYALAPLLFAVLLASACQSGQRRSALLPPAQAAPPALTPVASPAPPPPPKTPPQEESKPQAQPQADPVADLIAQVEKEYAAGQENYKAGQVEAARQNFDRAFELLLTSPDALRPDDRLQHEFDKITDGVRALDLIAGQDSDAFPEQKSEPAPIDEVNEVTPPVDPRVKAQAEAEVKATHSDLPLMLTDPVAGYINYFSNRGRGTLEHALERSGRYQQMIQRVLQEEGVPQDLIYLAQAESGFHPLALSRAGARGLWQFMASRARGYGLERNFWVDDRQDPEKSTRAAARHLKDLYSQFGDWYLAMAAYNSGPGTVQSAVKRTGYADFWELYRRNVLPRETRNYVPIIVAVTIMAKNPAQYGLDKVVPETPVPYDTVKINYPVDLRLVAQCVDASTATLQDLNPSLLRYTTPREREFELHLPAGSKEAFQAAIAAIPQDMRVWWRYHKVVSGDTLTSLARSYRTTPKAIADANSLDNGDPLPSGAKLVIPIAPGKHASAEDAQSYARRSTRYKVRKGDTVLSVAEEFGVPAQMVRRWNHLKGNSLAGRRVLYIHLPVTPNARATRAVAFRARGKSKAGAKAQVAKTAGKAPVVRHKVKRGETLASIASAYNTTVAALKRYNGELATLRPGMILIVRAAR